MMSIDVNLMVDGKAGQGVQSVGFILAKAFTRRDTMFLLTKTKNLE